MDSDRIVILGGGPAGLAAGYFARKRGLPFTIYEARAETGGNAATVQHGDFRFDTGAHRFHDQDAEVTREVQALLGAELRPVSTPSHIYQDGKFISFPLSPRSLLASLSFLVMARAAVEIMAARLRGGPEATNFEEAALRMYGPTIARRFLLNYSEKLWGLPCAQLSVKVSGRRMQELSAFSLLREALLGAPSNPGHMEGRFYYPRRGYGQISEALARACGPENIHTSSPIEALHHDGDRIQAVTVGGRGRLPARRVINTLPLPLLVRILDPAPPAEIVAAADSLKFRSLVVVAVFLDQDHATHSASLYFPGAEFPFTRISEPIHRSRFMAPEGKTSLCVEYPCFDTDALWRSSDEGLIRLTGDHLGRLGFTQPSRIIDARVVRLSHAYPVLEAGIEKMVAPQLAYLGRFSNLRITGRNGRFVYTHVHDMLRFGMDVIEDLGRSMDGNAHAA